MIRWIRDDLGTAPHGEMPEGDWYVVDVRHLVDKAGNPPEQIIKAVQKAADAWQAGKKVIIACDFGVSRSNAIAAGVISFAENVSFDEALASVVAITGEGEIKLEMTESVRSALARGSQRFHQRNILVTGAGGLIGRELIQRLNGFHHIVAPSRAELDLGKSGSSLAAYCQQHNIGQIVHLAYPRNYTNVNALSSAITMLRFVLETCKVLNLRLIYVSGTVLYSGYVANDLLANETTPFRTKGVYADTKLIEELLVDAYVKRGDLKRAICRLAPVYGPRSFRPRVIETFYQAVLAGNRLQTHRYRNGRPALDLLYVTDAAEGLARVVRSGRDDVFHIGTGKLTTTMELATLIAQHCRRDLLHEEITIDDTIGNIAMDITKARLQLNWSPEVELPRGLAETMAGLRNPVMT